MSKNSWSQGSANDYDIKYIVYIVFIVHKIWSNFDTFYSIVLNTKEFAELGLGLG